MKNSIKREQSHARMSFAECENQRSLAEGESNVRATLKHMKLSFHLILTLAAMLTMAQTAWATDPVTKTYAFSTRSLENNNSTLKMTDPDDNTSKTIITSASNYKFSNYGFELRVGAGGQYTIYPNVNGKVTRVEFTHMGRWGSPYYPDPSQPVSYIGAFSMSITGMTCNGKNSLTGNGTSEGEGLSVFTNEDASFTFVSTDAAGIEGSLSMTLGDYALMLIRSGCELKITYIPSVAPVHAHDFTYILDGNTLTATCGGTDGLACSLTNHQISTSLTADDAFDSDPAMSFPATLSNYAPFSTETGATKGNITYVNNTTSENLGTTMPSDPGQYTASITINAGGTNYTLTKTYNVYSYAQINNIYPQLNFSTEKYASTTAAGANETVTITFTSKFGETLETLTVTGATTNMSIGSGITSIGNNKYTFTMPAEEVNIGATFSISEDDFTETGENEYTIKTANGWGWFCFATNYDLASDGFSGKVVKLAGNVSSSEMAGKSGQPFKGTFDGQNYTLTFNRTAAENLSAPFHYINGATISNLHVEGTITGGNYERSGGLVGHAEGNITINNCRVSTEISTIVSGGAFHGGVIGVWNGTNAICTVTGCVYDGLIYNPNEAGVTTSCHGFIGWDYGNNMIITFTDCLSAPAAYGTGKYALGGNCFTFVYPNSEPTYIMTNCYYTSILGNRQGRPAATATVAPGNLGNATTDHGIVDGYKNGFIYDGNYYTPKYGDAVVEYRFNEWNERADVTINGTGENLVGVNITEEVGNIKSVTYNRPFTMGRPSTVMLPFNFTKSDFKKGGSSDALTGHFYEFKGVNGLIPVMEDANEVTEMKANTPYLYIPGETTDYWYIENGNGISIFTQDNGGGTKVTEYEGFELRGTYTEKVWEENDSEIGKAYVYNDNGELTAVTAGTKIRPTECYILKTKTRMTDMGITVTIPSQEWTGSAITFDEKAVVVKDGEKTLEQATDYIVTAPTDKLQNTGDYTVTINGAGNYAGSITAKFTIVPKVTTYGALTTSEDQSGKIATIDGTSLGTVEITDNPVVEAITLNRKFSKDKASTIMLPFDYTCDKADGGEFYDFAGVEKDKGTNQWVATMKEVNQLKANTPYMFVAANDIDGITFTLPEKVTLNTTGGGECQKADKGSHWTFKGTYSYMKWTSDTKDAEYTKERADEIGKVYGFAGVAKDGIKLGDFVKAASGARIRPLTCYLIWNNTPNSTRGMTRAAGDEELPSSIVVRLLSNVGPDNQDDDDNQGGTTTIGTLDTETGEIDFGGWYDMSGRKLSAKPTQKGLYIHNGKKVVIK